MVCATILPTEERVWQNGLATQPDDLTYVMPMHPTILPKTDLDTPPWQNGPARPVGSAQAAGPRAARPENRLSASGLVPPGIDDRNGRAILRGIEANWDRQFQARPKGSLVITAI
jgi:hypothetical protein